MAVAGLGRAGIVQAAVARSIPNVELVGFAEERCAFAHSKHELRETSSGVNADSLTGIAVALARGFLTPLEAEQARERLKAARTPREVASTLRELVGV